jgi:hypothetical protein
MKLKTILKLNLLLVLLPIETYGQVVTGTSIFINGSESGNNYIQRSSGDNYSSIYQNSTRTSINTYTYPSSSFTTNSWVAVESTGVNIGSSEGIELYSGAINSTNGNIDGINFIRLNRTEAELSSTGSNSETIVGWSSDENDTENAVILNSTGTQIRSATNLSLTGTTVALTGTANINTTGNSNTSIGNSGTGTVTLTSGSNTMVLDNSLLTITAPTTIVGTTNINTTGTANTNIGNTNGTVTLAGSSVNIGTNTASAVTIGNSSANSTISLNGNRLQNVGTGIAGTDAVNVNQLSSITSNFSSQITSLQNQVYSNQSGIAGVSAMANIPSITTDQNFNVGVGVGSFATASALAIGVNARISGNLTGKISASVSSGTYVGGAGLALGF